MNRRLKPLRKALWAGLAILVLAGSARLALMAIGWWIDFSEQPVKSDILVVLAGDYSRPSYAAELYAQGYAPDVWISRPRRHSALVKLDGYGIRLPSEESINRQILVKRGVPDRRIHLYGRDANSTMDEAQALRGEFPPAGKKILVVTSRFHARRSRMIFRRFLPEANVRVVAAPHGHAGRKWWEDKELAQNAMLETFKTLYFLSGRRIWR